MEAVIYYSYVPLYTFRQKLPGQGVSDGRCLPKLLFWPKYPDIQIFGSPKSNPNPTQIWDPVIFCSKSGKTRHVWTGCCLSKFGSTPISRYLDHVSTYFPPTQPTWATTLPHGSRSVTKASFIVCHFLRRKSREFMTAVIKYRDNVRFEWSEKKTTTTGRI